MFYKLHEPYKLTVAICELLENEIQKLKNNKPKKKKDIENTKLTNKNFLYHFSDLQENLNNI